MQRIDFIVFPGFQVMSLAALSVFEFANREKGAPVYDVRVLSETGGPIRSSFGVSVGTEPFDGADDDTLIVGGSTVTETPTPGLIDFVRRALGRYRRVAATCTGAFILAEAGLLDGRRATTHWNRARDLQARFPMVKVEEDRILHRRRPGMDLGRDDRGYRSGSGHDRKGPGRGRGPGRGQEARGLSPARGWPVAVFGAAGAGAQIGPYPERTGLCETESPYAADG